MMSDIWFAIKMLALTVVIVLVTQIQVGSATIEDRAYLYLQASPITEYLRKVAAGGIKLTSNAYQKAFGVPNRHGSVDHRTPSFDLNRSQKFREDSTLKKTNSQPTDPDLE